MLRIKYQRCETGEWSVWEWKPGWWECVPHPPAECEGSEYCHFNGRRVKICDADAERYPNRGSNWYKRYGWAKSTEVSPKKFYSGIVGTIGFEFECLKTAAPFRFIASPDPFRPGEDRPPSWFEIQVDGRNPEEWRFTASFPAAGPSVVVHLGDDDKGIQHAVVEWSPPLVGGFQHFIDPEKAHEFAAYVAIAMGLWGTKDKYRVRHHEPGAIFVRVPISQVGREQLLRNQELAGMSQTIEDWRESIQPYAANLESVFKILESLLSNEKTLLTWVRRRVITPKTFEEFTKRVGELRESFLSFRSAFEAARATREQAFLAPLNQGEYEVGLMEKAAPSRFTFVYSPKEFPKSTVGQFTRDAARDAREAREVARKRLDRYNHLAIELRKWRAHNKVGQDVAFRIGGIPNVEDMPDTIDANLLNLI